MIDTKSLTNRITAGAKIWLLGAGVKPVEEEVDVADGWVADLAGFVTPTATELKKSLKLHKIIDAPNYDNAIQRFYMTYQMPLTVLVEVKVNAADYRRDMGRKYFTDSYHSTTPAHLSYLAFPKGMVDDRELPRHWGRIIFTEDGSKLLKATPPQSIAPQHQYETTRFIASVGMRCFNKWTYREVKEVVKRYRKQTAESTARVKVESILSACLMVSQKDSMSLVGALDYWGIKITESQAKSFADLEKALKAKLNN
jgi:hypothetical protein